jgi:hypothetical protein
MPFAEAETAFFDDQCPTQGMGPLLFISLANGLQLRLGPSEIENLNHKGHKVNTKETSEDEAFV